MSKALRIGASSSEHLRKTLLPNKTLHVIKVNLVKRCLKMFSEIAETKDCYNGLYEQFGRCLKLGIHEDSTLKAKIAELLLRFNTSKSGQVLINLKELVHCVKEGLNDFSLTGESTAVVFLVKQCLARRAATAHGVADSEDLPLNIYWWTLQPHKVLHVINMNSVKTCLGMFAEFPEMNVDYMESYEQLSSV